MPLNDKQRQSMRDHYEMISRERTALVVTPRKQVSESTRPTTSVSRIDATQPRGLLTSNNRLPQSKCGLERPFWQYLAHRTRMIVV